MIKKYRVSGRWEHYFFANDETEANKHAQHTIKGVNLPNIEMNVQEIKEVEISKK
tara:strand:+ start:4526 stop:4690 length:165 start_codon:yes stop_codon:yes gene_type:complete